MLQMLRQCTSVGRPASLADAAGEESNWARFQFAPLTCGVRCADDGRTGATIAWTHDGFSSQVVAAGTPG